MKVKVYGTVLIGICMTLDNLNDDVGEDEILGIANREYLGLDNYTSGLVGSCQKNLTLESGEFTPEFDEVDF